MTRLNQIRLLVTGAGGFLGGAVCRAALAAGAETHALHRRFVDADGSGARNGIRYVSADLTDVKAVGDVLRTVRPDVIIHCAGYANAGRGLAHVDPALQDNLVATAGLLSAVAEVGGIRVVLSGSVETPGGSATADTVVPNSPYAASKFAEACYARMFHEVYGVNVSIARLAVVYGPGEARPGKLIPFIAGHLARGEPAELTSGRRRIDWIYIDDAAAGLLACAARDDLGGRTIEIGTGNLTPVAEVARQIAALLGRPDLLRFGALPDRPNELEIAVDAGATERLIGWRSSVSLEAGLAHTVNWFRSPVSRDPIPTLTVYATASAQTSEPAAV